MAGSRNVSIRLSVKDGELVRAALQKLGADGEQALRRLDNAARHTANSGLGGMESSLGRLKGLIAGAVGGLSLGAMIAFGRASLDAAGGLGELAEQVGTTTTSLQVYQYAATQTGVKQEELETAFAKFADTVGQAKEGVKQTVDAFNKLGVGILDSTGKLRSNDAILADVADALSEVTDEQTRATLARDLFGKSGQKLLPLLTQGSAALRQYAGEAARLGTIWDAEQIRLADQAADKIAALEVAAKKLAQTVFIDMAPGVSKAADALDALMTNAVTLDGTIVHITDLIDAAWNRTIGTFVGSIHSVMETVEYFIVGSAKNLLVAIKSIPDAWDALAEGLREGVASSLDWIWGGISGIGRALAQLFQQLASITDAYFNRVSSLGGAFIDGIKSGFNFGALRTELGKEFTAGWADLGKLSADTFTSTFFHDLLPSAGSGQAGKALQDYIDNVENDALSAVYGNYGHGKIVPFGPDANKPSHNPNSLDDLTKLKKALDALDDVKLQATWAVQLAAAAHMGQGAVNDLELSFEAAAKAQDLVQAGALKGQKAIDDWIVAYKAAKQTTADANFAQGFVLGTQEIERQNELLQAQLELIGAAPEVQAHEIALLRVKLELQKEGRDVSQEDFDARVKAYEQQQLLTQETERTRQAMELWLDPLKQSAGDLQALYTGVWKNIYSGGVTKFSDLAKQVKTIFINLAAEITTLLTFRPAVNLVLSAVGLGGLSTQLGYGGSILGGANALFGAAGTAGGAGGVTGGFNVLDMLGISKLFGGSGGNGLFGGIGTFLSQPIGNLFGTGAGVAGSATAAEYALAGGGIANASIGSILGGVTGLGFGLYNLASGNTLGGITGLLGGGLGLAGALIPGLSFLGPVGMGIGLLGGLLGGLFGGSKPPKQSIRLLTTPTDQGDWVRGGYAPLPDPFGYVGYAEQGSSPKGAGNTGDFLNAIVKLDQTIARLLDPTQVAAVATALQSTEALKVTWRKGFTNEAFDVVKDRLDTILTGLYGSNVASTTLGGIERSQDNIDQLIQQATAAIQFKNALDDLGKSITDSENAVRSINQQFDDLAAQGQQYGFGSDVTATIEAQRKSAIDQLATDFNAGVAAQILAINDPNAAALQSLEADQAKRLANAEYLNTVTENLVDINKLEELFGLERQQLVKQQLEAIGKSWKDFFDELTLGPLSALSPSQQYAQAIGEYRSTVDALNANNADPAAQAAFQNAARTALAASRAYYASSQPTADLFAEILALTRQLGDIPAYASGGEAMPGLALVGEQGPELVRFRTPASVHDARATARILGSNDNGEVAALLRQILDAVRTADGGNRQGFDRWTRIGQRLADDNRAQRATRAAAGR